MIYDLAIIGAGPAGLAAARVLSQSGKTVVLIDDHPKVGGKLHGQLHEESKGDWWIGKEVSQVLYAQLNLDFVTLLTHYQTWSIEKDEVWKLHLSQVGGKPDALKQVHARKLLLATGSVEKPLPLPGWDRAGVLAIGGAQVLTNDYQIKVGERAAFVGVDILSLSIARSLKLSGVDVVGIFIEPASKLAKRKVSPLSKLEEFKSMAKYAPSLFMRLGSIFLQSKLGRKLAITFYPKSGLKVWGIPLYLKETVEEIYGDETVTHIQTTYLNAAGEKVKVGRELKVDTVCSSGGLMPQNELAEIIGCSFVRLDGLSGVVPLHNEVMETEVEDAFVAGNITGIESAKVAEKQGVLAGMTILNSLGESLSLKEAIEAVKDEREKAEITFHPDIVQAREQLNQIWEKKKVN